MKRPVPELLTVEEAAEILKCKPGTLRKKAQARVIPHYKLPGAGLRFERSELALWIEEWRVTDKYSLADAR